VVVGAVLNVLFSSIQTLDRISIVGWVGLAGIMSSIITLAVAVGVQDRPSAAPQVGFWSPDTAVARDATFVDAINAVSVVVFAYAGTPNFFNIVGEMKNQRDYTKSVITCQAFVTAVYLVRTLHLVRPLTTSRSLVALCITLSDSTSPLLLWAPPARS
jgi:amino acid permease